MDTDHSIAVWAWETGSKIASATGHPHRIFCAAFNPSDDSIVTVGVGIVKFWSVTGRLLRGKSGQFTQGSREQAMLSLTISKKGRIYSGSEQGEIYRWKGAEVDTLVMAHEGPVFCLWVCRDGLCSGGKDGKVMVWSLNLKPLVTFDLRSQSTGLDRTRIRSVCWLAKTILVGTIHSEVFEIDIESGTPNSLLTGHCAGKVSFSFVCINVHSLLLFLAEFVSLFLRTCKTAPNLETRPETCIPQLSQVNGLQTHPSKNPKP